MLTKIFFTLLVMIVVGLVFRTKTASRSKQPESKPSEEGSLSVRTVTYGLIGVLILISALIFVFKYQSDNRIVNIRVISEDGTGTTYQARQKEIKGRQFLTLEGIKVTLGESDRVEMEQ